MLTSRQMLHHVLNARAHAQEADIITRAGVPVPNSPSVSRQIEAAILIRIVNASRGEFSLILKSFAVAVHISEHPPRRRLSKLNRICREQRSTCRINHLEGALLDNREA